MMISKKRNTNISVKINNEDLEECDSYKYLGVYIDKSLSWKPHINYICTKIAKACGALAKIRHYVGISTLTNVYYALVNSYTRYGLVSWGTASAESLKPLVSLVNRAIRIMSFAPLGRLNTKPVFKHLKILDVNETFALESAKFIFKVKHGLLPIETIARHFDVANTNSRPVRLSRNQVISLVPFELRSQYARRSIQLREGSLWQEIPAEIRNCESFNCFKNLLKEYYIQYNSF